MRKNIENYIESIEKKNTAKVIEHVLKNAEDNIKDFSREELENYIINSAPRSPKSITTICYVIRLYGKWLNENSIDNKICDLVESIDQTDLWKRIKPMVNKKYISYDTYLEVLEGVSIYEEYNADYYKALFKCIYEGIFNEDMSVIKNLKASDIIGNRVKLFEDNGNSYEVEITADLAKELKLLAEVDTWERENRFSVFSVNMKGLNNDSIFKIERRNNLSEGNYRNSYYAKLRKVTKEYIGYLFSPTQIFVSGMMNRIKTELEKNGIDVESAFDKVHSSKVANDIICKELERCGYSAGLYNFKSLVEGHTDLF